VVAVWARSQLSVKGWLPHIGHGDTIELGAMAIRLNGAATPEWDARGGFGAMDALRDLMLGKVVTCELDGEITYGRCAAICTIEGADVAQTLVLHGLVRDCPRDSSGRDQRPRAQGSSSEDAPRA
jgi:micrococcal nuclease